ncbi:hypothetical protein [Burkholderia metallica]|uniref:hypothetical protein n=1 Tax=Burkholderia metallica TaxID=488729 RepID=UPI001CF5994D|nr:hypothetical protein [Burkholderia metallica]MCA7997367.1 hypothetical protein [Burkholderia metallica]
MARVKLSFAFARACAGIPVAPDRRPRRCGIGKNGRHCGEFQCNGGDRKLTYYVSCALKPAENRAKGKIGRRPRAGRKKATKKSAAEAAAYAMPS